MVVTDKNNRIYESLRDKFGKVTPEQRMAFANCLSNEQYVLTKKGNIVIRDLPVGEKIDIISFNIETRKYEDDVAVRIDSGKKEVYEIELGFGKKIKATADHTFFIYQYIGKGKTKIIEKKVSELKPEDRLILDEYWKKRPKHKKIWI